MWQIMLVSFLVSSVVSAPTLLLYVKLKPEPEPTATEKILDGLGGLFGGLGDVEVGEIQDLAELGILMGGGDVLEEVEDAIKIADMGLDILGRLEEGGVLDVGDVLNGPLQDLQEDMLKDMEDQLGVLPGDLGELAGKVGELNLPGRIGDLGEILGGDVQAPNGGWDVPPEDEEFDGLDALDEHLEAQ